MGKRSGVWPGVGVSAGIASGPAVVLKNVAEIKRDCIGEADIEPHLALLQEGIAQLTEETEKLLAHARESMSGGE